MTVANCARTVLFMAFVLVAGGGWSQEARGQGEKTPSRGKAATGQKSVLPPGWQQPRGTPFPGYEYYVVEGFHVLIHGAVLAQQETSRFKRLPLDVLQHELKMISGLLPSNPVALLRTVPIWVEWKKPGVTGAVAVYHSGPTQRDRRRNVVFLFDSVEQKVKSNAIEIVNMESLTAEHQPQRDAGRCVLLHELSHAVHHHMFGRENVQIKDSYEQALARGLYKGRYAITNKQEYFAELSCAYFDKLDYTPHSEAELKQYDPIGHRLMEMTWGTQKQILSIRDAEARKSYGEAVRRMRSLIRNGKLYEAKVICDGFQTYYRGTKTANLARQQYGKSVATEANRSANRGRRK